MSKTTHKIIVLSVDAMVYEDLAYLRQKTNFKFLYDGGSSVDRCRTIYPSVTYPCHVTMSSGVYPDKHGVTNNLKYIPGQAKNVPWNWFADVIKTKDIFTAAKEAGYSTAAVFWPVTGNHPSIDYLVAEYWPQFQGDTFKDCFLRAGTTEDVYDNCVRPFCDGITLRKHPATDWFIMQSACAMIRKYQPDFLAIHPANIDDYRHHNGVFSERVTMGLDEVEDFISMMVQATKDAGVFEKTDFFIVSDHGQIDLNRSLKPNAVFVEKGLIKLNPDGSFADWTACSHSTGMSAQIRLKNPDCKEDWERTYAVLKEMRDDPQYGIEEVLTVEETEEREHLKGDFSFVIETDGRTSFSDDWKLPLMDHYDFTDYRLGKATHGYNPKKGPQPTLIAYGPDIRKGVRLANCRTVDQAPTYAKILGVELPDADGQALTELLK